jgi:plasma kallikrein
LLILAAHCVNKKTPSSFIVRAGEWDTQTTNEFYPYKDYNVQEIIIHPQFYKAGSHNNIALLVLDQQVTFQPNIGLVCLPTQNQAFESSNCLASGWGKEVFGKKGKFSVILKKIELPLISHDDCENMLRTNRLGNNYNLHNSNICAGGEAGKDTCKVKENNFFKFSILILEFYVDRVMEVPL